MGRIVPSDVAAAITARCWTPAEGTDTQLAVAEGESDNFRD